MADAEFDPFEEHDREEAPPRVRLGYKREANRQITRRITRLNISFDRARLIAFGKIILIAIILFGYPAATMFGHKLDDSPVALDDSRYWAVESIGVTSTLISRELEGPGWLSDKSRWHPHARLTALPAWQNGLLASLSDHGRLLVAQMEGQRDQDLLAGVRLITPKDEEDVTARLLAAREAFSRYNDRVSAGVTIAPGRSDVLIAKLDRFMDWANTERLALSAVANPGDGWITSRDAIEAVYHAKAYAHVAHELLVATGRMEDELLSENNIKRIFEDVLVKWRRAANTRPLFVANHSSDGLIGTNHSAILAFRLEEARRATMDLKNALQSEMTDVAERAPDTQ